MVADIQPGQYCFSMAEENKGGPNPETNPQPGPGGNNTNAGGTPPAPANGGNSERTLRAFEAQAEIFARQLLSQPSPKDPPVWQKGGLILDLGKSYFAQQYLKGVLDNMEAGRRAVQEKVKILIPAVYGPIVGSAGIAYFALDHHKDLLALWLLIGFASGTSFLGIIISVSLSRILEATYDFYVSAVIHASIVMKAVNLEHPWTDLVAMYAKLVDKLPPEKATAKAIREALRTKIPWPASLGISKTMHPYESDIDDSWSRRILEMWKSRPGNLFWNYSRILGYGISAHIFCIIVFIGAGILFSYYPDGFKPPSDSKQASMVLTNLNYEATLTSVSSNISVLNGQVESIKTNLQSIIGH